MVIQRRRFWRKGIALGHAYALQEHIDGELPDPMSVDVARTMVELLDLQIGDPDVRVPAWPDDEWAHDTSVLEFFRSSGALTAAMADEIDALRHEQPTMQLPAGDVQHGDFHQRNALVRDGALAAVVDWEGASLGDRRLDAFVLAVSGPDPDAGKIGWDAATTLLDPSELACYAAKYALCRFEFYLRARPENAEAAIRYFEPAVRPVWLMKT